MRIEIVHDRDPDSACDLAVFIDGEYVAEADVEVYDVDPGAGYDRAEWDEHTVALAASASPLVALLVTQSRNEAAGAHPNYVMEG